MKKHNHVAVWVTIVISQLLGWLWYSPLLFINSWLAGQGKTADQVDMADPTPFIYDIIGSILLCYFISWIVVRLNINSASGGLTTGLFIGLGILVKSMVSHYKFLGISDSIVWIDFGQSLVTILVASLILAVWRKKESTIAV